jgi:hypothetical protein
MSKKSHLIFAKQCNALFNYKNLINGITVLKYKKDKVLKNVFYDNTDYSFNRLIGEDHQFKKPCDRSYQTRDGEDIQKQIDNHLIHIDNLEDLEFVFKDNTCVLNDDFGLIMYGDIVDVKYLLRDKVICLDSKGIIYYYDDITSSIKKLNKLQMKQMVGYDKNYHTLIVYPYQLKVNYQLQKDWMCDFYPADKKELYFNLLQNSCTEPRIKTFGKIKKLPKNNIYNLNENEIVYIQDKGAYKRNQITFRVLTERGELFQLYSNQLETIPEHQWPDLFKFQIARKTLLMNEQAEGYPLLIKIDEISDDYISGYLINGSFISLSRKIIPKLPCINQGQAEWIFVPQWYYEKRIMELL